MRPIVLTISLALDVFLNLMLRFVILRSIVRDLKGSVINNNDGNNNNNDNNDNTNNNNDDDDDDDDDDNNLLISSSAHLYMTRL